MIESRLVIADNKFSKELGARFGIQKQQVSGTNRLGVSGNLGNTVTSREVSPVTLNTATGQLEQRVTEAGTGRTGTGRLATTLIGGPNRSVTPGFSTDGFQDLMSNLPVNALSAALLSACLDYPQACYLIWNYLH